MQGATPKIAFVSPHCVLDFTNGAATATLDALAMLAGAGFHCEAFCNTRIDAWEEVLVEEIFAKRGAPYRRALALECDVLPYVIDPRRVGVKRNERDEYVRAQTVATYPLPSPLPEGEGDQRVATYPYPDHLPEGEGDQRAATRAHPDHLPMGEGDQRVATHPLPSPLPEGEGDQRAAIQRQSYPEGYRSHFCDHATRKPTTADLTYASVPAAAVRHSARKNRDSPASMVRLLPRRVYLVKFNLRRKRLHALPASLVR